MTAPTLNLSPHDRIEAASTAHFSHFPPRDMEPLKRAWAQCDRHSTALANVTGALMGLVAMGELTPERVAKAMEDALRLPDDDEPLMGGGSR